MASDLEGGLLGRLAIHYRLITIEQLDAATHQQIREPAKRLGEILVEQGLITDGQLGKLLAAQAQYLAQLERKRRNARSRPMAAVEAPPASPDSQVTRPPERSPPQNPGIATDPEAYDPSLIDLSAQPEPPAASLAPPAPVVAPRSVARTTMARPPRSLESLTWLHSVLQRAAKVDASDIHIHSGSPVRLRRFCKLVNFTSQPLPVEQAEAVLTSALDDEQYQIFDESGEVDLAYAVADVGRFRVNVYRHHRGINGVFHFIPPKPPTFEDLGLPTTLAKLTNYFQGLILVTGPAGCGKSSTLAALVDILNEEREDHILTIEDPVEYIHPAKRCVVNQRQVRTHTESFARALRAALREDPDVICIGELRDLETISLALSAAETGHLVIATLHTNNAIRTINRVVGAYPPSQQSQVRTMLSESLRAVISQRLLPRQDGEGVALALEILHVNKAVGNLIRENRTFQIHSILQTGAAHGMQLLDLSLTQLVNQGLISKQTAALNSDSQSFK